MMKQLLIILAIFGLSGCQINKPLSLTTTNLENTSCNIPVSELTVVSPLKGENVFRFEDIISSGVVTPAATVALGGYKRADFNYLLEEDSESVIKETFKDLFPKTGNTPALLNINFNYYITDTGAMSNKIILAMTAKLEQPGNEHIKAVTTLHSSYSTFPLTYPSSDYLNTLFSEGLVKLEKEICSKAKLLQQENLADH
ncbi:hypothetical protein [Methylophaga sulfidovorans]|uniref:Lipoprotein n=1 Tax=Methylophaga sulfidovorans TaxID=45496 RepID=A0A1I4AQ73_9GAMM|nr:hypothetical protein [Methylophaga sulfidovorans]SFK58688.1 hypothetical protein SAMN04488079_11562 [Methylophaga sulfidovorans]